MRIVQGRKKISSPSGRPCRCLKRLFLCIVLFLLIQPVLWRPNILTYILKQLNGYRHIPGIVYNLKNDLNGQVVFFSNGTYGVQEKELWVGDSIGHLEQEELSNGEYVIKKIGPKTLVVLCTKNTLHSSLLLIESLKKTKDKYDFLVIDDGSNDGTPAILRKNGVHVISKIQPLGKTDSLNQGYHYAKTNGYKNLIIVQNRVLVADGIMSLMEEFLSEQPFILPLLSLRNANGVLSQAFEHVYDFDARPDTSRYIGTPSNYQKIQNGLLHKFDLRRQELRMKDKMVEYGVPIDKDNNNLFQKLRDRREQDSANGRNKSNNMNDGNLKFMKFTPILEGSRFNNFFYGLNIQAIKDLEEESSGNLFFDRNPNDDQSEAFFFQRCIDFAKTSSTSSLVPKISHHIFIALQDKTKVTPYLQRKQQKQIQRRHQHEPHGFGGTFQNEESLEEVKKFDANINVDNGIFTFKSHFVVAFALQDIGLLTYDDTGNLDKFSFQKQTDVQKAYELGQSLSQELGWSVLYLSEPQWYDLTGVDLLIIVHPSYLFEKMYNDKFSLKKVAWIKRNHHTWIQTNILGACHMILTGSEMQKKKFLSSYSNNSDDNNNNNAMRGIFKLKCFFKCDSRSLTESKADSERRNSLSLFNLGKKNNDGNKNYLSTTTTSFRIPVFVLRGAVKKSELHNNFSDNILKERFLEDSNDNDDSYSNDNDNNNNDDLDRKISYIYVGDAPPPGGTAKIIQDFDPSRIANQFKGEIYGKNWDYVPLQHETSFLNLVQGSIPHPQQIWRLYQSTSIVVNEADAEEMYYGIISNDVYHALASGALVISNNVMGMKEVFKEFLPSYESSLDLSHVLNSLLNNREWLQEKRNFLQELVLEKHTYKVRAQEFFEYLNLSQYGNKQKGAQEGNSLHDVNDKTENRNINSMADNVQEVQKTRHSLSLVYQKNAMSDPQDRLAGGSRHRTLGFSPLHDVKICVVAKTNLDLQHEQNQLEILLSSLLNQQPSSSSDDRDLKEIALAVSSSLMIYVTNMNPSLELDTFQIDLQNIVNKVRDSQATISDSGKIPIQVGNCLASSPADNDDRREEQIYFDEVDCILNHLMFHSECTHFMITDENIQYRDTWFKEILPMLKNGKQMVAWDFSGRTKITDDPSNNNRKTVQFSPGFIKTSSVVVAKKVIMNSGARFLRNGPFDFQEQDLGFKFLRKNRKKITGRDIELIHRVLSVEL